MENKRKIRKWLWLGMDKQTAKKYQRKIAADNIRIIKNESLVVALLCSVFAFYFLSKDHLEAKGIACIIGVSVMFVICIYANILMKKKESVSKREAWFCMGLFIICAYMETIWLGTFVSGNELAVTSVCLFVFIPTNFDILPIYNLWITFVAAAVFFLSSYLSKTPDKFLYDLVDAIFAIVIGNLVAYEKVKIKWESVRVHEILEEERDIDVLTGIWNRRAFEREVDKIVATKELKSMVVIMMDIDKFKRINDRFGHETGDAYLKHFCELFRGFIEKNTVVGRRSGDEFFMFIYNYGELSRVENNIKEFYKKLEKYPITLPDGEERVIRVSAGAVWTTDMNNRWTDLLCAADEELYFVKEHGRNSYTIEEYCANKKML